MNELSVPSTPRNLPLRLLVPLGALAAMAAFSGRDLIPGATAEGLYLAVLAAAALLPVGWLSPAPAWELGLGAVLATAAVWALPPGPGRGATVVLVLTAALAVAAARRLLSRSADGGIAPDVTIPLALGLQILLRGELLLAPSLSVRLLVALLVLPVAGALAVTMLARRHGAVLPLIAAGTALTLAPGFNAASTLALLALAAGDTLGRQDLRWPLRAGALAVVLAPIAWQPGFGVVIAACGLALAWPRVGLALAVLVAAGLEIVSKRPLNVAFLSLCALPLLVPAVLVPTLLPDRRRIWNVLAAALLVAAAPLVPDLSTLAAPLALAALSLRRDIAYTIPQRVWTGALLGGTTLLASYPWLRPAPVITAISLLGLLPGPALAIGIAAVFLGLAAFGHGVARTWSEPVRAARLAGLAAACLMLALLQGLPTTGTPLLAPQVPGELDAGHPVWETALAAAPVSAVGSVVVESYLANGAALAPGTPVAVVKLTGDAGRSVDWTLRAGDDTGEWAARRPDLAQEAVPAPTPWVSWVADGFFAQRYRSRHQLDRPEPFAHLRIERAPGVPPDLTIALYQVEVRR